MTDEPCDPSDEGVERRKFIKGAATVAWASPLILTMAAKPAGAQEMSCIAVGMLCDACVGLPCCDEDGIPDGGCCCSPLEVDVCDGVCVGADAQCATPAVLPPGTATLQCYVPETP